MLHPHAPRTPRERLLRVLTVAARGEIAWTVYLGRRLPHHYVANQWDLAWVGMDTSQIVLMVLAAWAAWRRRAVLVVFASSLATLFLLDAWFDVTTARRGDIGQSVLLALVAEVPAAIALFWVTWRVLHRINTSMSIVEGTEPALGSPGG